MKEPYRTYFANMYAETVNSAQYCISKGELCMELEQEFEQGDSYRDAVSVMLHQGNLEEAESFVKEVLEE